LAADFADLTWFGPRTSDSPRGAARISFSSDWQAAMRAPLFLSVANATTGPRLLLTRDAQKAALWSFAAEEPWFHQSEGDRHDGSGAEWANGYIQLADVPDAHLWLSISPQPILQTRVWHGPQGEQTTAIECHVMTVSPKKELLLRYARHWSAGGG
jgi:hypothetical protein